MVYTSIMFPSKRTDDLMTITYNSYKVEQDGMALVEYSQKTTANEVLLYTRGVGPCIAIIINGIVNNRKFVGLYHWSGMSLEQLETYKRSNGQIQKNFHIKLAENIITYLLAEIRYRLYISKKAQIYCYQLTAIGGERASKGLRGTELEIKGLKDYWPKLKVPYEIIEFPADKDYVDVYVRYSEEQRIEILYKDRFKLEQNDSSIESDESDISMDDYCSELCL